MEDEEETQSHASGGSGSQGSPTPTPPPLPPPRPNGRITVTVAAVPPSSQPNALTLALPIQQNQQQQPQSQAKAAGNGGGGGGREDCWSEGATGVLIDAWGERYLELSRGNLKQKHWKDVADIVSSREDYTTTPKTDIQCKNRIDTVKKKYKLEKAKIASGGGPSKWPFFERLDQLIGTPAKLNSSTSAAAVGPPSASQRVPMGIPMGVRSAPQFRQQQQEKFPLPQLNPKQLFRKRPPPPPVEDSDEEESEQEPSPDSADDFPPGKYERKRPRNQRELLKMGSGIRHGLVNNNNNRRGKEGGAERAESEVGNPLRELTRAILKFGEAYEHAETLKLQQLVDMEKQRMKFAKEMELQRMQFFMKTQLELSQLKCSSSTRRVGNTHNNNNNNNHHRHNNSNNHNAAAKDSSNNNSDSSN